MPHYGVRRSVLVNLDLEVRVCFQQSLLHCPREPSADSLIPSNQSTTFYQTFISCHLDPELKQSGDKRGEGYHISKRGSPYLRRALWLASSCVIIHDKSFAYAYQHKLSQGKTKMQALAFISHKLLNVFFTILKNNIDYVPVFPPDVDVSKLAQKALDSQSSN